MKNIETLVPDIYYILSNKIESVDSDRMKTLTDAIASAVTTTLTKKSQDSKFYLRPSNYGKPCKRQLWYASKNTNKEDMHPSGILKYLYGHILEALVLYLAEEAGHEVTDRQKECKLDGVVGSMDARIDGCIVDVKSASSNSFTKFSHGMEENDSFGYIPQLSFYAKANNEEEAAFVAIDKTLGKLVVYKPPMTRVFDEIEVTRQKLEMDTPPVRHYEDVEDGKNGNRKLCMECSYCAYKHECWNGLRTFLYSTGPKYFTHVESEPRVQEVIDYDKA